MPAGNPNGYGSLAMNPRGGITQRTPGQRFISPANAAPRMTPNAMRAAQQSATAGIKKNFPKGSYNVRSTPVKMGPTRNMPKAGNNMSKGLNAIKNKKGLAMGLGAAVVGGLAYSGRRGEGSSGGRAGMTRY